MSYLLNVLDDCKTLIRQSIIYLLSSMYLISPTLQHTLFWVCRHGTVKGPYCHIVTKNRNCDYYALIPRLSQYLFSIVCARLAAFAFHDP